jgi:hypothetical protein
VGVAVAAGQLEQGPPARPSVQGPDGADRAGPVRGRDSGGHRDVPADPLLAEPGVQVGLAAGGGQPEEHRVGRAAVGGQLVVGGQLACQSPETVEGPVVWIMDSACVLGSCPGRAA